MAQEELTQSRMTWIVPLILVGSLVSLYFVWPDYQRSVNKAYQLFSSGDQQQLESWIQEFGAWGPIVILIAMMVQTLLALIPSTLIMVVSVVAYGGIWGGGLAFIGLVLAACMGYFIGRLLGPVTVHRLIGKSTEQKIEEFVERYGVWAIVAARISPALSTDAVSFVAGLVGMSFPRFLMATSIGILPLTALVAYLGQDIERLKDGLLWISLISLGIFIAYVIYDHKHNRGPE